MTTSAMTTSAMTQLLDRSFIDALHARGPAPDRADELALYGFLVGRWEGEALCHENDGAIRRGTCEIHAGWVLEGRALQDVWIVPKRGGPRSDIPDWGAFYGTTLRVYDPGIDAWHIVWSDPVRQVYARQLGRAEGKDIVQTGTSLAGVELRWRFTEITPDSFHWIGERKPEGGGGWRRLTEYIVRRVA